MKKVMIGILILIPILVVLTIGMVTSILLSVSAYISVESIELENSEINLEITYSTEDYYYIDDLISLIGITVYPERATNQDLEFTLANIILTDTEITDDNSDGRDDESGEYYLEFVKTDKSTHTSLIGTASDDLGYLRIGAYCYFDIVITAEGSITARCTVSVTGDVTAITISGETSISVGESTLLEAIYTPIDAVVDNVTWTSINPETVFVDNNGVITGVSVGTASIMASVVIDDGTDDGTLVESNLLVVEVSAGATKFGNIVYTHKMEIGFDELGIEDSSVEAVTTESVKIENNKILIINESAEKIVIMVDNEEVVLEMCDENDLVIVGYEYFNSDVYVLERGGTGIWLSVDWKSDLKNDNISSYPITWSSSNKNVISVEDGYVKGLSSSGESSVTITAKVEGIGEASIEMAVARKIAVVLLVDSDSSMEKGLARETVIGSGQYDGIDTYVIGNNTYAVEIKYPVADEGEEYFYDNFVFSVSSDEVSNIEDYITFNANTAIFNYDAMNASGLFTEKVAITITVSAKYPRYNDSSLAKYATASFTFYVVDGIYTADFNEMQTALNAGITVTLSGDVELSDLNAFIDGNDPIYIKINEGADLYGNGYMYYSSQEITEGLARMIVIHSDDVTISNLTVRINPTAYDTTISEDGETYANGVGISAWTISINNVQTIVLRAVVEYCIVENGRTLVTLSTGGQMLVEGTIMRNASGSALHVRSYANLFADLTLKNSVISNTPAPSNIQYSTNYNGDDYDGDDTREALSVREGSPTRMTVTVEGFLDAYCWFDISQGSFISNSVLENALGEVSIDSSLLDFVQSVIQSACLSADCLSSFRRSYNNGIYVHVAFMSTGFNAKSYMAPEYGNFQSEDTRFSIIDSTDLFNDPNLTGQAVLLTYLEDFGLVQYPMYLWSYDNTVTDLTPGSECIVNSRLIDRLHGIY